MSRGRPGKSATTKQAEGTLRSRDRGQLALEQALALTPLSSIDPPCWLPHTLDPTWRAVTADLCKMGAVMPSDLVLLEQAFRLIVNTMRYQAQLDRLNDSVERNREMADSIMDALAGERMDRETAIQVAELATGCAGEIKGLTSSMIACEAAYERILGKFGIGPSERVRLVASLPKPPKDPTKKSALNFLKKVEK